MEGGTSTLHALAHPLRLRILEELHEPGSAAEVARRVGESRQNVNHHVKELERGGLVHRVAERPAGPFVEALYQATASAHVLSATGASPLLDCDSQVDPAQPLPASGTWSGVVHSLHLAPAGGDPMLRVHEVRAVEGRGLEGDRYFDGTGTFSAKPGTGRHVTLIELEALRGLQAETGIRLVAGETRRNVVTCGVPLNHLLGQDFALGNVVLRGMRLCEPCSHLSRLLGKDVKAGLIHRGGLRADIVRGGELRVGDPIRPA
jgi:MOSC domain-containing protein YiiM/DNA-binding transcriptional ArsR family regulator